MATAEAVAIPSAEPDSETVLCLQDFVPLGDSLEAELSAHHWRTEGVRAFSGNAVPFIINNSGRLSECAAQLLFGYCLETEPDGAIDVLELGAGCGLFALYFLDAFRAVCERQDRDFYERIRYVVTDGSAETVSAWTRNGQFEAHAGKAVLAVCDATSGLHPYSLSGEPILLPPLRAIFANYILDSLPAAIVRHGENGPEQLCIRTNLDAGAFHLAHPAQRAEELAAFAASADMESRARLLPYLELFTIDAKYQSQDADRLPFQANALALVEPGQRTMLNHGALACLEQCSGLLAPDGMVVVADYGPTTPQATSEEAILTRFGHSAAAGLSFPLLEQAALDFGLSATAPENDDELPVHIRLFARAELPFTRATWPTVIVCAP
jgi:SAM-dependent methyltransferase